PGPDLDEHVQAGAAGRRKPLVVDDYPDHLPALRLPRRDGGPRGAALGAHRKPVRGILDVRTAVDLVATRADRGADPVLGIRGVRTLSREGRDADKVLVAGPQAQTGSGLAAIFDTRTRRIRRPSMLSTTNRAPPDCTDSPTRGKCPSCATRNPPSVS